VSALSEILIVEDDEAHDALIRRAFEAYAAPARLRTARSLKEALQAIEGAKPDLVITDLRLPDGDGAELVRVLRERAACPVVVMTAFGDQKVAVEAMRLGALDYVVKSDVAFAEMPHVAARALREWGHILQRSRAEEALRQSEERHRSLVEGALDLVGVLEPDGRVRFASPSVRRVLGFSPDEMVNRSVFDFTPTEDAEYVRSLLGRALRPEREAQAALLRVRARSGEWRTLEVIGRSLLEGRPEAGILLNARDVTDRLRAEEQRRRLESQLRQAQKLETLGTLAGGIAHDFNNILHAVIGCIELARSRVSSDLTATRYLEQSLEVARRGRDLVQQILQFSRQGEPRREALDLGGIASEVVRLVRATFPPNVEVRAEVRGPAVIQGDATQMHQVLMNLATNARQAMGSVGGVLEIRLGPFEAASALEAVGIAPGDYVLLEVGDSGPGVPVEIKDRIFEPFFTTREVGSGTGLGLSVVHGIVREHGGAIVCSDGSLGGALFKVYLPRAEATASVSPGAGGEAQPSKAAGVRVLLVDDDPAVLYVGQALLEELGHSVVAAPGPQRALELFAREPFGFDLAILDEQMPRMPGTALLRELRRMRPDLPVIVASGQGPLLSGDHESLLGVRWLHKPYDLQDLEQQVQEAVGAKHS
jgi:PAS domain S-box-containing protein